MLESTQKRAEQAATPLKSPVGDLRRAKSSASASVQELKAFLQGHRGKSSKELLGDLGKSNLVEAMIKSTAGMIALLLALTIVPYLVYGKPEDVKETRAAKKAASAAQAAAAPATAAATTTGTSKTATGSAAPDGVDVDKAKKAMGLDETKIVPDNVNPREKDLDNLLDGVK